MTGEKTMEIMRFLIIFSSIGLAAIGQIIIKVGMGQIGQIGFNFNQMLTTFTNPLVLGGLVFYGVSLILWLVVLSKEQLSFVYPMVAFSYLVTMILAKLILKENIPLLRWFGLGFILFGIILVARS
jgi:uncharacterized membrane protein